MGQMLLALRISQNTHFTRYLDHSCHALRSPSDMHLFVNEVVISKERIGKLSNA